jgi:hypothetical protein
MIKHRKPRKRARKSARRRVQPSKAWVQGTFLTQVEVDTMKYQLEGNSVAYVCTKMTYGRSRYYEVLKGIVTKWKMLEATKSLLKNNYRRAVQKHNLLARHLTEVHRTVVQESEAGPPQAVEVVEREEPPVSSRR